MALMLNTISQFGRVLFEPVAIAALWGFILVFWHLWREGKHFEAIALTIALCFMLGWRMLIGTGSKRYSIGLLLPGILLAIYALWVLAGWVTQKYSGKKNSVFIIFVLLLTVGCGIKFFRFNRYDTVIMEYGKIIANDANNRSAPQLLAKQDQWLRYLYYSGLEAGRSIELEYNKRFDIRLLRSELNAYLHFPGTFYVMFDIPDSEANKTEHLLPAQEWQLLARQYVDNRRRKVLMLFRYTPMPALPEKLSPENLIMGGTQGHADYLVGGDMENHRQGYEKHLEEWRMRGLSFFQRKNIKIPRPWTADPAENSKAEFEADPINAIAGQYSLRLKSSAPFWVLNERAIPAGDYQIHFLAKGQPGSEFSIFLLHRASERTQWREYLGHFRLETGDLQAFHVKNIPFDFAPDEYFLLNIEMQHGEAWFDEFKFEHQ